MDTAALPGPLWLTREDRDDAQAIIAKLDLGMWMEEADFRRLWAAMSGSARFSVSCCGAEVGDGRGQIAEE